MPANVQITAALSLPTPVPPDQDCPPNSLNAILQAAVDHLTIVAADPEAPSGQNNSIAELALNTANTAISQVSALQAQIPARRTSGSNLIPLGEGGAHVPLTWQPEMPNANYEVHITFHGPSSTAADPPAAWCVENGSRTASGCMIRFMFIPANYSFSFSVVAL